MSVNSEALLQEWREARSRFLSLPPGSDKSKEFLNRLSEAENNLFNTPPASAKNETGIEPVAWRVEHGFGFTVWHSEAVAKRNAEHTSGTVTALYSAPQLAEITRQRDEALAKVAELGELLEQSGRHNLEIIAKLGSETIAAQVKAGGENASRTGHLVGRCGGTIATEDDDWKEFSDTFPSTSPQAPGVEVSEERAALRRIADVKFPAVDTIYAHRVVIDYCREQADNALQAALGSGEGKNG